MPHFWQDFGASLIDLFHKTMEGKINIALLKEFIKTLIASEVAFPDILPRPWGNEFTRMELQAIHLTLKFILITTGDRQINKALIEAFKKVEARNVHWFLCTHREVIVSLLIKYSNPSVRSPAFRYELN